MLLIPRVVNAVAPSPCDASNIAVLTNSSTATAPYNETATEYIAYGDPTQKNPNATGSNYFIRCLYGNGGGALTDCNNTAPNKFYNVATNCSFLTWDSGGT